MGQNWGWKPGILILAHRSAPLQLLCWVSASCLNPGVSRLFQKLAK